MTSGWADDQPSLLIDICEHRVFQPEARQGSSVWGWRGVAALPYTAALVPVFSVGTHRLGTTADVFCRALLRGGWEGCSSNAALDFAVGGTPDTETAGSLPSSPGPGPEYPAVSPGSLSLGWPPPVCVCVCVCTRVHAHTGTHTIMLAGWGGRCRVEAKLLDPRVS